MNPHAVRRIKSNNLLGLSPFLESNRPVFEYQKIKTATLRRVERKNRTCTYSKRYPKANQFLRENRDKIKVFADVGAGNIAGAPTTIDARLALGGQAEVFAVDKLVSKQDFATKGITQVKHDIRKDPLPFECDALRLANVSQYLDREELERTLDHIWHSLKPHGFLLSAGPLGTNMQNPHNEQILIKVRKTKKYPFGFVILK